MANVTAPITNTTAPKKVLTDGADGPFFRLLLAGGSRPFSFGRPLASRPTLCNAQVGRCGPTTDVQPHGCNAFSIG